MCSSKEGEEEGGEVHRELSSEECGRKLVTVVVCESPQREYVNDSYQIRFPEISIRHLGWVDAIRANKERFRSQ